MINITKNKRNAKLYKKNVMSYVKNIIEMSSSIYDRFPSKDDSIPTVIFKVISLIDNGVSLLTNYSYDDLISYLNKSSYLYCDNIQFIHLFFEASIINEFEVSEFTVNHSNVVDEIIKSKHSSAMPLIVMKAVNKDIGTLFFFREEYRGDSSEITSEFYYSSEFKFDKVYDLLWKKMNNKIIIDNIQQVKSVDKSGIDKFHINTKYFLKSIAKLKDPFLGKEVKLLDEFYSQNIRYKNDGIARTYLFYGMQGTGKSTFAQRLSERFGGKILKINATDFSIINLSQGLGFILCKVKPDFLIVDDIDRIDYESNMLRLFDVLAGIREEAPHVSIIFTANNIRRFDPAFLRPGRIDEILEFDPPNDNERMDILKGYMNEFGIEALEGDVNYEKLLDKIITATAGFSHAYIKEVALQLKYCSLEKVLELVEKMKRLIGVVSADEKDDEKDEFEPEPEWEWIT